MASLVLRNWRRVVVTVLLLVLAAASMSAQPATLGGNFGRLTGLLDKWEQIVITNPDGSINSTAFGASKYTLFPKGKTGLQACSFTVVGPETVLTAGHCVSGYFIVPETDLAPSTFVVCMRSDGAGTFDRLDLALCRAAVKNAQGEFVSTTGTFPAADYAGGYESVATDATHVALNRRVLLTGHGCTASNTMTFGTFAGGYAKVSGPEGPSGNRVKTLGGASLCPGDSGGAIYAVSGTDPQKRVVVGVGSSKLPAAGASLIGVLSSAEGRTFIEQWLKSNPDVRVCGLNFTTHCRGL